MSIDSLFTSATVPAAPVTNKRGNRNVTSSHPWTMARIDAMPGKRNNFVCVMVDNPKQQGSIANRNYALYGTIGKPSVTVAAFIASYPIQDGGVTRAERSLTWDLDRGLVRIVSLTDADAPKFEPVTNSALAGLVTKAVTPSAPATTTLRHK